MMRRERFHGNVAILPLLAAGLIAAGLAGCSNDGPRLVPVSGKATIDDLPLDGATVSFVPDSANSVSTSSTVVTGSDGSFKAMVRDRPGLAPGKYKVLIIKEVATEKALKLPESIRNDPMQLEKIGKGVLKNVIPKGYADLTKTIFEIDVPESGKNDITLNLNSKGPR